MTAKVIVTNVSVLRVKYGVKYAQVRTAIQDLIAADKTREASPPGWLRLIRRQT